uniref:UPF0434 protein BECKTC1821D_GA0114238_10685 n=1 Tax=Candidatus Kentrum sp. TC TaxID=2126339 RepID=A0A450Z5N0_9GAMM|nr:MAG: hypothetical protein BECKTC1821D_GA0114238_10685 [Candidatus Kentron sp. TC]
MGNNVSFQPQAYEKNTLDKKLLDIIVCPICKGPLVHQVDEPEFICRSCQLAYPIRDDIPVMLEEEARELMVEEAQKYKK